MRSNSLHRGIHFIGRVAEAAAEWLDVLDNPGPVHRCIILVGPPAAGKTTLARELAAQLGCDWVDTDAEVERSFGRSIREVFVHDGEPAFRRRERDTLQSLLGTPGARVIAAGGGALLDREFRHSALRRAHVLALTASPDVLIERARAADGVRPLLAGGDPGERLRTLLAQRSAGYAEAHAVIAAGGALEHTAAQAVASIRELRAHRALVMPLGADTYRVHLAPLASLGARIPSDATARLLVTDAKVSRALRGLRGLGALSSAERLVLPGRGERDKTIAGVRRIWDAALAAGIDRNAVLVGIGGGVVTDLTGFAAATLLRGVRYVSAPTTLLAMVDASVGGKTGFDHARGKNLIGAFHQPTAVVCDASVLRTLTRRDLRAGLAEVVKIALACAPELLTAIERDRERLAALDLDAIAALVPAAIQAKIDVVARDERESGERALLNFGHTIGHAIERAAGYRLPHGHCVAIGMRAALHLGVRLGITPAELAHDAFELLDALRMPSRPPESVRRAAAVRALSSDKKRAAGGLRFVLATGRGASVLVPVSDDDAVRALDSVLEIRAGR